MEILDCTLRDGGYYNKWDFTLDFAQEYLELMSNLEVKYCELGFRFLKNDEYLGPFAFTKDSILKQLRIPTNIKLGVMLNANEFIGSATLELVSSLFPESSKNYVTFVRIATAIEDFETALILAGWLKDQGYMTFINIMQMTFLQEDGLQHIYASNLSQVDVLYFADSTGSMTVKRTKDFFSALAFPKRMPIGIHAHDNSGLAFANSIFALNYGAKWVDGTLLGMGRGPGNTKLEQLLLEREGSTVDSVSLVRLTNFLENWMSPLKEKFNWGPNPFYDLSGRLEMHPTYVQELIDDELYQNSDIIFSIKKLANFGAQKYKNSTLKEMLKKQFKSVEKVESFLESLIAGREVLIVVFTQQTFQHLEAIRSYIEQFSPFVIGINSAQLFPDNLIDAIASSNPLRVDAISSAKSRIEPYYIFPVEYLKSFKVGISGFNKVINYPLSIDPKNFQSSHEYCILPKELSVLYATAFAIGNQTSKISYAGLSGIGLSNAQKIELSSAFKIMLQAEEKIEFRSLFSTHIDIPTKSIYGLI